MIVSRPADEREPAAALKLTGGARDLPVFDEETSEEVLEAGTVACYISVSDGHLSQGHDVHDAVDARRSRGSGASSSTGPSTGVAARAQGPCRETREGRADSRVRRQRRRAPRATVGSWREPW